ncbi:MAG: MarR family transcriptional regulator, partial [Ornithinimicrobium sp.]
MVKSTPAIQREAFERGTTEGTDLSWALRAMLWGYNDVQRHIARQMNLGASDVAALEHLLERPDLGPADIASLVGMSTASATVLVDRLETAGHVERRAHP